MEEYRYDDMLGHRSLAAEKKIIGLFRSQYLPTNLILSFWCHMQLDVKRHQSLRERQFVNWIIVSKQLIVPNYTQNKVNKILLNVN